MRQMTSFDEIASTFSSVFSLVVEMFKSSLKAMTTFYDLLDGFNNTIVKMSTDAGNGTVNGLPVYKSIGMIRYLIGDIPFYFIYLIVLYGCLMTILKLIYLILSSWNSVADQTSSKNNSMGDFTSKLGKFLKKI